MVCGRYVSTRKRRQLRTEFRVAHDVTEAELEPDYNVAPTKPVYAVIDGPADDEGSDELVRQLCVMRWGLVPFWAKSPTIGSRLINARAETVATKPAFRRAFERRRCLLPADGYYEWYASQDAGARRRKQPFYITSEDGRPLALAGLYDRWRDPAKPDNDSEVCLWTCTIVTTAAEEALSQLHDRMPVRLDPDHWEAWLDPRTPPGTIEGFLGGTSASRLRVHPVSTGVNDVRHNGPDLLKPLRDVPRARAAGEDY